MVVAARHPIPSAAALGPSLKVGEHAKGQAVEERHKLDMTPWSRKHLLCGSCILGSDMTSRLLSSMSSNCLES